MLKNMWIVYCLSVFALAGCTVGKPELSSLSEITGITFSADKKTTETYTVSTSPTCASSLTVSGQCDKRFGKLQFSVDNEVSWRDVGSYTTPSDGDCSDDGEFKLYFANICMALGIDVNTEVSKKVQLRSEKNISQNIPREVFINFTKSPVTNRTLSINSPGPVTENATLYFTVTLDQASTESINVDYAPVPASAASYFTGGTSGTLTFTPGETSKQIALTTLDSPALCELDKPFAIELSNPSANASIAIAQGSGVVENDDYPTISLVDTDGATTAGFASGSESTPNGSMKVELSAACPSKNIDFTWYTTDASATSGSDYDAQTPITATIMAGTTQIFLPVTILSDSVYEPGNEKFLVTISSPTYASPGTFMSHYFYIIDDDFQPTVSLTSNVTQTEGTTFTFTFNMTHASSTDVVVPYTFAHVTTNSADFTSAPATTGTSATILAGTTSTTISYVTKDDSTTELTKTFSITMNSSGFTGYTRSSTNNSVTGTLNDNDSPAPPTNISLSFPSSSPSVVSKPTFTVWGVSNLDNVRIYTSATCTPMSQVGFEQSTGSTAQITLTSDIATTSSLDYYATREIGGVESQCSNAHSSYQWQQLSVSGVYGNVWNSYVKFDALGLDLYHQSGTLCDGTSETSAQNKFGGCIHSGELKKSTITGFSSCTNLSAIDGLDVFEWACNDSSGTAVFYSKGLKQGKGLRDILTSGPNWLGNTLVIRKSGGVIASSVITNWWSNQLITLGNNISSSLSPVSLQNRIYVVDGDINTYGIKINSPNISVVTLGTSRIIRNSNSVNNCSVTSGTDGSDKNVVFCIANQPFIWLETNIGSEASTYNTNTSVSWYSVKHSRINNSFIISSTDTAHSSGGVDIESSKYNIFSGVTLFRGFHGLKLSSASKYNMFRNLKIGQTGDVAGFQAAGIYEDASSTDNTFIDLKVSNHRSQNGSGITLLAGYNILSRVNVSNVVGYNTSGILIASGNNILSQIISAFTHQTGIFLLGTNVADNTYNHLTLLNHLLAGIFIDPGSGGTNTNRFNNVVVANSDVGINVDFGTGSSNFLRNFFITNYQYGAIQSSTASFFNSTRAGFYLNDTGTSDCTGLSGTTCNGPASATLTTSFVRDAFTETANPQGAFSNSYTGTVQSMTAAQTLNFDTWTRNWGLPGNINNSTIKRASNVTSEQLKIWDFAAAPGGRLIDNSVDGLTNNTALTTTGAECTGSVAGSNAGTFYNGTYLYNTIEIDNDGIGNDNTLCEDGENCFFTPNTGAYQGSEIIDYASGYCEVNVGFSSIKVFKVTRSSP